VALYVEIKGIGFSAATDDRFIIALLLYLLSIKGIIK
jgi:hypothetical protein